MINRLFVGVSKSSLMELMSQTQVLKSLCLRGTDLIDQALYNFVGSSLEMLDISNTKVCCQFYGLMCFFFIFAELAIEVVDVILLIL